ncbi:molybdopterin oxidoreductase family protein [Psychromarinibacter sp. C21-152]|uniref:Molybdopterin oxidoreductase family protein n=1 Tax=Psychromarinibacter sediminicola TaxID=3033385 RepID=A0AAE3NS34_9RHOB|nr:molybdopterin oxidoreductase family protein [Psychromarinibacter sediminicola]MDF0600599.1 molybdopterin oxidoreductase family protein [Psychromarinibacter sediminicola]
MTRRRDEPAPDLSPHMADEVAQTTCYMCACRCGIDVFLKQGADGRKQVSYIQGNRDHPKNRGVLCAKGSAGIMQHLSPARLRKPLRRNGPRGSGEFEEIEWEEALSLATEWLGGIRETDPKRLAFFTGRDQSQSLTSLWAQEFGTPNYAAHGGFCSVNMAAAGIYTMGGAFWEFGAPDWERAKMFMLFGVAEDHDSNPIKLGLSRLKARGAKIVGVNPVRTGYNAIADEWVGITPGTDGLFVLALVHELFGTGRVDVAYLARYTNAGWLLVDAPGTAKHGLFARDADGKALILDRKTGKLVAWDTPGAVPELTVDVTLPDGRTGRPVFQRMAAAYLAEDYAPEAVAARCGVTAATIRRLAAELARVAFEEEIVVERPWTDWLGRRHDRMVGRPVAFHAMRGISAHSNGFQTCRAIHLLQILLGSVECPGGFRFKPPYPKPVEAHPKPHGDTHPCAPLPGPHLGFPAGPEDLLLEADGSAQRIDKAFTWDAPLAVHGMMHMVIANAAEGDPYRIDTLFLYMANMAWNSSMNTGGTAEMLTRADDKGDYVIPHIIYADAYSSETVAYADLVLPDTTYLERHDCISLLDRPISEPDSLADAIRWPVVDPDRDVRGFQSVLIELGARLGLPAFCDAEGGPKYRDYADYMARHERRPGIGPLAGWRGDGTQHGRGAPNPDQVARYRENGGFFTAEIPEEAQFFKPWNAAYQDWAVEMGLIDRPQPYVFQLWSEPLQKFRLAAEGHGEHQPPDHLRARIGDCFSPLPAWYPPFEEAALDPAAYPLHAITQRPAAMYHSWGSQNAWLRQIHGENPLYVPNEVADAAGLADGDWARVTSHHGEIVVPVRRTGACNGHTLWTWNAIGKRKGAWALRPGAPETTKGFLMNHLIHELLPPKGDGRRWTNSDPVTGQAAWFDLRVRIEKAEAPAESLPASTPQRSPVGTGPDDLTYGGKP